MGAQFIAANKARTFHTKASLHGAAPALCLCALRPESGFMMHEHCGFWLWLLGTACLHAAVDARLHPPAKMGSWGCGGGGGGEGSGCWGGGGGGAYMGMGMG